jgi:hypothetical protein
LIQRADLFGPDEHESAERLVAAVLRILGRRSDAVASAQARLGTQVAGTAVNLGARNEPQNVVTGQPSRAASSVTSGAAPDVTPMNGLAGTDRGLIDRWRLTHTLVDASAMAQLEHQGFGHRAYSRPLEQTPPWVRIRAVVACDYLGEIPGWQELRGRFAGFLSQESIRGLIYELADITDGSAWRQRGTQRRSWLEADLTLEDEAVPAASAILFLPERDIQGRLQHGCAELTLHVDFAPRSPAGISEELLARRPQYWRERFAQALALPGELADFLERQFGLAVSGEPAGQFGIRLQARQTMAEMVDVSGIKALPAQYAMNHFTGWAVAEPTGKTTQELAPQMMLDLSERVLHLDGSVQEMSGLP